MIARNGALAELIAAGARILESACGPCAGMGRCRHRVACPCGHLTAISRAAVVVPTIASISPAQPCAPRRPSLEKSPTRATLGHRGAFVCPPLHR